MPGFDGTGPGGGGVGTGRRMGPCYTQDRQFSRPGMGRGMGMGQGMGIGRGRRFRAYQNVPINQPGEIVSETDEIVEIENSVSKLEQRMDSIDDKLNLLLESKTAADQKGSK